jgi:hypothetical protein
MKQKIIFRDLEGALALECLVKIFNLSSSAYIRDLILKDVQNIFHRSITISDVLHGFEIHVVNQKDDIKNQVNISNMIVSDL